MFLKWLCFHGFVLASAAQGTALPTLPCPARLSTHALTTATAQQWAPLAYTLNRPEGKSPLSHEMVVQTLQTILHQFPDNHPVHLEAGRLNDLAMVPSPDFQQLCIEAFGGRLIHATWIPNWGARLELALHGLFFVEKYKRETKESRFFQRLLTEYPAGPERDTALKLLYYASVKATLPTTFDPRRIQWNLRMRLTPFFAAAWMKAPPESTLFTHATATEDSLTPQALKLAEFLAD